MTQLCLPLVVFGNPENRRVAMFCDAARRLNLPPALVIAYEQLLAESAADWLALVPPEVLVRLESPGENTAVEQALIRRGGRLLHRDASVIEVVAAAAAEHGRIAGSALWHAGYRDLLEQLELALGRRGTTWMNHPADIPMLFDKTQCQALLAARGVSVPAALPGEGGRSPGSFDELLAQLDRAGWPRVFIKLRYGSSASGVVAFQCSRSRMQATTSVELVREAGQTKLFNSLRVRRYTNPAEIAAILDELCREGVHVERWVPKASFAGRTFDLRVVAIAGEPRHLVMRTSPGPITNLHLGNRRGDLEALLETWPAAAREDAWNSCRAAAARFPRSLYCGIDLAPLPGLSRHAILELNAFGDLLPGVTDDRGDDTYAAELRAAPLFSPAVAAASATP